MKYHKHTFPIHVDADLQRELDKYKSVDDFAVSPKVKMMSRSHRNMQCLLHCCVFFTSMGESSVT